MNKERAKEIQDLIGINHVLRSDDELTKLGEIGRRYKLDFWEVCEAVWHWTVDNRAGSNRGYLPSYKVQ